MKCTGSYPILSVVFIVLLFSSDAQGFIYREFTIQEIIDGSTNIVFGKIKNVDTKRLNAIIEVEEDLKGKKLDQIKLNIATGWYVRGSSPQKMIRLLKVGMPLIVFLSTYAYPLKGLGILMGRGIETAQATPKVGGYSPICAPIWRGHSMGQLWHFER